MRLQAMAGWVPRTRARRALAFAALCALLLAGGSAIASCNASGDPGPSLLGSAASTATPRQNITATPRAQAAEPTVVLPPGGEAPPGGDQPSGPSAASSGSLPENTASGDLDALQDVLEREINAYRASTGTEVAVAVTDIQTGEVVSVRGNAAQRTGCTIHMFALFAITSEFQAGRGSPSAVSASVYSGIGTSYPPQVRAFLDSVFGDFHRGEQRGRDLMASWGMTASVFDHVAYYGDGTQNNLLTALETNMVLTKLYRGQLFEPEWTSYALNTMRNISPGLNYIIPGQLPAQASVAHKIGYYADIDGWVVADAGIVTFVDGTGKTRAYAITYLSQRAPTEYAGYSFGASLSRIVWDHMQARYRDGEPPALEPTPTRTPRPSNTPPPTWTPRPTTPTPTPIIPTTTPTLTVPPPSPAAPSATP